MTRTELQDIDWEKGDKVTAQLGSLMDQGKCLFLLHFYVLCENHDMIRSICEHIIVCVQFTFIHVLTYMWYQSLVAHFCDSPLMFFQNLKNPNFKNYSQFKNPNLKLGFIN